MSDHQTPPTGGERPLSKTEARQGVTLGRMRWVLLASIILAVVAFIIVFGSVR
jgi:hypothetical protein